MRNDLDLAVALLGDGDRVAEVAGAAIDLDAVVQELLKRLDVEDLVVDWLRAVDDELLRDLLALDVFLLHVAKVLSLLFGAWVEQRSRLSPADSKAVYVRWLVPLCAFR